MKSERRKWRIFCTFSKILWEFSILVHCVACVCFNSHPPITILALDSCYDQIMASNYILLYYLLRNWFSNAQWNILHFFISIFYGMSNLTADENIFIHYVISKNVCINFAFSNFSRIFWIISKYIIYFFYKEMQNIPLWSDYITWSPGAKRRQNFWEKLTHPDLNGPPN